MSPLRSARSPSSPEVTHSRGAPPPARAPAALRALARRPASRLEAGGLDVDENARGPSAGAPPLGVPRAELAGDEDHQRQDHYPGDECCREQGLLPAFLPQSYRTARTEREARGRASRYLRKSRVSTGPGPRVSIPNRAASARPRGSSAPIDRAIRAASSHSMSPARSRARVPRHQVGRGDHIVVEQQDHVAAGGLEPGLPRAPGPAARQVEHLHPHGQWEICSPESTSAPASSPARMQSSMSM